MIGDAARQTTIEADDICIGPYTGQVIPRFLSRDALASIYSLPGSLLAPENRVLDELRNRTVCIPWRDAEGRIVPVVVKAFRRPSRARSLRYRRQGSKARRAWEIARFLVERGIGTPEPLGFLERWDDDQLTESYFLTEFQAGAVDVRSEVQRLLDGTREVERLKTLVRIVAREVRSLHAIGVQHKDLGFQNILVRREADGWSNPQFIDLNRAKIRAVFSARQRARDVKSLWLPKRLRPVFFAEYFGGCPATIDFLLWETWYRALDKVRNATRDWRHPSQTRSLRARGLARPLYPSADF